MRIEEAREDAGLGEIDDLGTGRNRYRRTHEAVPAAGSINLPARIAVICAWSGQAARARGREGTIRTRGVTPG
ncbi:MAG: hypothetical protein H0T68_00755 [Gemmatimonadales bacterium]|nr:hypothetical protein [Gemmatimonadales bacterium]